MSLYDLKHDCQSEAAKLPMKYEKYSINELADKYCEAIDTNNAEDKNIYISALLLRFWSKIDKMYNDCRLLGIEREDAFHALYDCIDYAVKCRVWQDPEKHTNAEACINTVISSRGTPKFRGEAKFQKNDHISVSLDEPISDEGEATIGDTIPNEEDYFTDNSADSIIQALISNNMLVEAIIADTIASHDVFKHEKKIVKKTMSDGNECKYTEYSSEFWPFQLVRELDTLDENYAKYFTNKYSVNVDAFKAALHAVSTANHPKLYKMIEAFTKYGKELLT